MSKVGSKREGRDEIAAQRIRKSKGARAQIVVLLLAWSCTKIKTLQQHPLAKSKETYSGKHDRLPTVFGAWICMSGWGRQLNF